jgi:type I restriction enzyme S subunit
MEKIRIEECCEILDSIRVPITAKDRNAGPYPYYGANGIQDYVDEYIFDDEIVLVAEDGGHFGSKVKPIAYRVSGKCWVNNHAHVLRAKEMIDIDYLCYSLMFYNVGNIVNGATRQKLNQKQLRQMTVPKVSLGDQKTIVDKLSRIVAIKEKKKKQIDLLDDLIKSRFVEMFGDPVLNEKNWSTVTLNDVCTKITDGEHQNPSFCETGVPMVMANNIRNAVETSNCKYVSEVDYEKFSRKCNPEIGDILLVSRGATIGRCCENDISERFALMGSVILIKQNRELINSKFMENWFRNEHMSNKIYSTSSASAQQAIYMKDLRGKTMILPPIELQNKYAELVKQVDKLKVEVQKSLDETQILFDSLMQEYFE